MSIKCFTKVRKSGLLFAGAVSVGVAGPNTVYAESSPPPCSPVQIEPASGVLPTNIGGVSLAQEFAGWSAFRSDSGQPSVVQAHLRAVGASSTVPLSIDVEVPNEGRINVRFAEPIAPGSQVELDFPDCFGRSVHTMDFVEPVEFSSLLPAIEVGPPVRFIDEEGAFLRDVLVVRQPLSDIEGSRGLFLMQLTKDGAPLGPGPLDTMEVPISCAAGDERGEINIKVDILSPVGDVVAEGVETLVQYDCAESQEEVEPRRHRGDDGGILGGTDAGNFAADAGVGGTEAPASSGCSVGVSGGEPAGLGVWTFLVAVMFGRRRRSRV